MKLGELQKEVSSLKTVPLASRNRKTVNSKLKPKPKKPIVSKKNQKESQNPPKANLGRSSGSPGSKSHTKASAPSFLKKERVEGTESKKDSLKTGRAYNSSSPNTGKKSLKVFFSKLYAWPKNHKVSSIIIAILLIILTPFTYLVVRNIINLNKAGIKFGLDDVFSVGKTIVSSPEDDAIKKFKQTDGRTNVLLLGIDARSPGSSLLTDTIIVVSFDHATQETAMISIPRDIRAQTYNGDYVYYSKINSTYSGTYNSTGDDEQGFDALAEKVKDITGLEIHYGIRINFQGFREVIDYIGGVTVDVENSFTDYTFPLDDDSGVMTVSFSSGVQDMNGERALQYARSRHSPDNGEGTDYARARRQQKVIEAIRQKLVDSNLIQKASYFNEISNILGNNVKFYKVSPEDIENGVAARNVLAEISTFSFVLDPYIGSYAGQLLRGTDEDPNLGFAVIPTSESGNYDDVRAYTKKLLNNPQLIAEEPQVKLVYTNGDKYQEYINLKFALFSNWLSFSFSDRFLDPGNPGVLPDGDSGVIYFIKQPDSDKTASFEYYKNLLKKIGYDYNAVEVENISDLPSGLQESAKFTDILIRVK